MFKRNLILSTHTLNPALIVNEIQRIVIIATEESREADLKKLEKFINSTKLSKFWLAMKDRQQN